MRAMAVNPDTSVQRNYRQSMLLDDFELRIFDPTVLPNQ